jgi:acyl-CoA reductase-like NAD-dependent aldehyde dehydrogenase
MSVIAHSHHSYNLGDPNQQSTSIGPVISSAAVKAIEEQVQDAISKGAVDATPENASFASLPTTGSYVAPRLLTNVTHDMAVAKTETFGPLIPVIKVKDDAEAVALMNDSEYGLTASIWTQDLERASELISEVEAGTVFVNRCDCPNPVSSYQCPSSPEVLNRSNRAKDLSWIGWKNSGLGSTLGPRGFDAFVTLKSHHIRDKQA